MAFTCKIGIMLASGEDGTGTDTAAVTQTFPFSGYRIIRCGRMCREQALIARTADRRLRRLAFVRT